MNSGAVSLRRSSMPSPFSRKGSPGNSLSLSRSVRLWGGFSKIPPAGPGPLLSTHNCSVICGARPPELLFERVGEAQPRQGIAERRLPVGQRAVQVEKREASVGLDRAGPRPVPLPGRGDRSRRAGPERRRPVTRLYRSAWTRQRDWSILATVSGLTAVLIRSNHGETDRVPTP